MTALQASHNFQHIDTNKLPRELEENDLIHSFKYAVKLNVDGSSSGNLGMSLSGFGGILRNSGECLLSFFGRCGYTTNTNAELMAIAHGLNAVWNAGFKTVICESDSQTAPQLINENVLETHPYATMLKHIKEFLSFDWCMSFTHTVREGNSCVDRLAK